eukprot:5128714-Karenia_brevis.AAC.1
MDAPRVVPRRLPPDAPATSSGARSSNARQPLNPPPFKLVRQRRPMPKAPYVSGTRAPRH